LTLTLVPEVIDGTVNDPVRLPEPHKAHGSYHWTFERALSLALIPLIVTPFVTGTGTPVLDALIGSSVVLHSHIGFDAIVTDYVPKRSYPKSAVAFKWGLRAATVAVLLGIYEFQINEVGMVSFVAVPDFRYCRGNQKGLDCLSVIYVV
jgi:succinate dehydrogenase (ubiquinone) membrane anchor subunit